MDDNQVWALVSPRSAIHVARLRSEPLLEDELSPRSWWLEFPCLGGADRSIGDVAYYSPDLDETSTEEMRLATEKAGSRGMYCMKPYCEGQRRKLREEADAGETGDTTINNNYENEGWVDEAWQVMVTLCVIVFIACVAGIIWHAVDMSRDTNVAHQKTLQIKYAACALDENPRLCLQKVQE